MQLFEYTQTITTAADGSATVYFGHKIRGRIVAIKYEFGTLAATADFTMTGETSGVPIFAYTDVPAANAWWYPRALLAKNTAGGTPSTDAFTDICAFNERIKLVVAQGGNVKTGTMTIYTEE